MNKPVLKPSEYPHIYSTINTVKSLVMEYFKIDENIEIKLKNTQKGLARWWKREIVLPLWLFKEVESYQIYYIAHEITHIYVHENYNQIGFDIDDHGIEFKIEEKRILKQFGIDIEYKRAFAKRLRDSLNGDILFTHWNYR